MSFQVNELRIRVAAALETLKPVLEYGITIEDEDPRAIDVSYIVGLAAAASDALLRAGRMLAEEELG